MERPGRVFSREQLLDGVWGSDVYIDERTVDVHVGRLRKALNRGHGDRSDPHRARRRLLARRPFRQGELIEDHASVSGNERTGTRCGITTSAPRASRRRSAAG